MLNPEHNRLVCETGSGTPMGEVMRRYWQPVGVTDDLKPGGKPKAIKVMGEELVLFRDDRGKPALLGLHCSHRLTSLAYGRVEDGGIRCPFHGWLYDASGRCLEQPAEPEPFCQRVRHLSYPCEESGGLVFAYMGPADKKPLLPRYEVLAREDGTRKVNCYTINSNYLQNLEGAVDTVHSAYLHRDDWSQVKHLLWSMPKPEVVFLETAYGIWQKTQQPDANKGYVRPLYTYFIMPAGFGRLQESRLDPKNSQIQKHQSWYVPIDDTKTARFEVGFAPLKRGGKPYEWPSGNPYKPPGPENDYYRNYEGVDTISGIPTRTAASGVKQFVVQDSMVNESQGVIVDRAQEHLGTHDKVLTAIRLMLFLAIEEVRKGRDPKHIIREAETNGIVYISGTEDDEIS